MAYRYIDDWLGCLDEKTFAALWYCCENWRTLQTPFIAADAVFEVYTPDDYCARPAMMMAFLVIFEMSIILYEDDPCQPYALHIGDYGNFVTSVDYIQQFSSASAAPCTQQSFP